MKQTPLKNWLIVLTLLSFIFFATCKKEEPELYGSISGTITDSETGEPVPAALITMSPGDASTATGTDGKFSFQNLDPKTYALQVIKDDYGTNTKSIAVNIGEDSKSDIQLTPVLPILNTSVTSLNFNANESTLPLTITNIGKSKLEWQINENIPWLSVNPISGTTETETDNIIVSIDRSGLSPNSYSQVINIISNGGASTITITMVVGSGNQTPKASFSINPEVGNTSTVYSFDGSTVSDDFTPKEDLLVRWQWETGGLFSQWTTEKTATIQYQTPGHKVITLEVKDSELAVGTKSQTLIVEAEQPTISVAVPNITSQWTVGTQQTITWYDNISENIKIELYNGEVFSRVIASSVLSNGAYTWDIPAELNSSENYNIKISSATNANLFGTSNKFTIQAYYINITFPVTDTQIQRGESMTLNWSDNIEENVKIELFKNGSFLSLISSSVVSNGVHEFTLAESLIPANDYQIKISGTTSSIFSLSEKFAVIEAPYITINNPTSSENWNAGSTQEILWETNISGSFKVDLFKAGVFFQSISANTSKSVNQVFSWNIPQDIAGGNDYQIKVTSSTNEELTGISSNFTIIEADYFVITVPAEISEWNNSSINIEWSTNLSGDIYIELYKDNIFHSTISNSATASARQYSWDIPYNMEASHNYQIRIWFLDNPEFEIFSGLFTIKGFINISEPTSNSVWSPSIPVEIRWYDNITEDVKVELYNGSNIIETITQQTASSGLYTYTPVDNLGTGTAYRVKITSIFDENVYSYSDFFEIVGAPMKLVFNTNLSEGTTISLPLNYYIQGAFVDVKISWGDGTIESVTTKGLINHTYNSEGTYTVLIAGLLNGYGQVGTLEGIEKLIRIEDFGDVGLVSLHGACYGAINLTEVPSSLPSSVTSITYMFGQATLFNFDIGNWDVSNITDMDGVFNNALSFNQDIGSWNVENVKEMRFMFSGADAFNQDISNWNVSNVTTMYRMFSSAGTFNQSLGGWNMSNVTDLNVFLNGTNISTTNYDQTLIGWSTQTLKQGVTFDANGIMYSAGEAAIARQSIIDNFSWTITDGGQE